MQRVNQNKQTNEQANKQTNMNQQSVATNLLRLVAAFFVVYVHTYHALPEALTTLGRTAMPLIFALCGFSLYSEESHLTVYRARKAVRDLTAWYVLSLLLFAGYGWYQCSLTQDYSAFHISPDRIFDLIARCASPIMPYGQHLGFLVALTEVFLLYRWSHRAIYNGGRLTRNVWIGFVAAYYVVTVIAGGYLPVLLHTRALDIPFAGVLCDAVPFFLTGYYIAQNKDKLYTVKKWRVMVDLVILYAAQLLEYWIVGDQRGYLSSMPFVFLVLVYALQCRPTSKAVLAVSRLGREYWLPVCIVHPLLMPVLEDVVRPELWAVAVFVATLAACVVVKTLYLQFLKLTGQRI